MIRLNRTTEYGLIALSHMSLKQTHVSAREIADQYQLPFEITAKTLQRLKEYGLLVSAQGSQGGYLLSRPLAEITLAEFLEKMEGGIGIVQCCSSHEVKHDTQHDNKDTSKLKKASSNSCEYSRCCGIQGPMNSINQRLQRFFSEIRLSELGEHR